jgi:hypothetical protein
MARAITPILTDAVIAAAAQRSRVLAFPPARKRCSSWWRSVAQALQTLSPDGWCTIGAMIDVRSHGVSCSVRYHVDTGHVHLARLS